MVDLWGWIEWLALPTPPTSSPFWRSEYQKNKIEKGCKYYDRNKGKHSRY